MGFDSSPLDSILAPWCQWLTYLNSAILLTSICIISSSCLALFLAVSVRTWIVSILSSLMPLDVVRRPRILARSCFYDTGSSWSFSYCVTSESISCSNSCCCPRYGSLGGHWHLVPASLRSPADSPQQWQGTESRGGQWQLTPASCIPF